MQTIIRKFEERFNIRVLTPEYAILLHLFERKQSSCKDLLEASGYSRTRHHAALRMLVARELIVRDIDERDLRVKLYGLTAYCREELRDMFAATPGWINGKLTGNSVHGVMPRFTRELKRRLGINHTSCAYEILLFLYDTPDLTVYELFSHSNFSSTTFYNTLSQLKMDNFVTKRPDENDTRRLRCSLTPVVSDFMRDQHILLLQWLQTNLHA